MHDQSQKIVYSSVVHHSLTHTHKSYLNNKILIVIITSTTTESHTFILTLTTTIDQLSDTKCNKVIKVESLLMIF